MWFKWFVVISIVAFVGGAMHSDYQRKREHILDVEASSFIGHDLVLSENEEKVNKIMLAMKHEELLIGYRNESEFASSLHFFKGRQLIRNSKIYKYLRQLPKGSCLHLHLLAGVSLDYLIQNFTYRSNLYAGRINGFFKLKFFSPENVTNHWTSVSELRKNNSNFDVFLEKKLGLWGENYGSVNEVWKKFKATFSAIYDLVSFRPVFEDYITQLLQELYDDNVMYVEIKGTYMALYELDGTIYDTKKFFEIFIKVVENFKKSHMNFLGARYIHSIYRGVDQDVLDLGLKTLIDLKKQFPDFIAGFDFVGYEEESHSLYYYKNQLLEASKHNLKFFFHAGETNWYGHTDHNLIDAILLNSSRIGHGFALSKHPELIKLGKNKKIPIELCPISNQVLMLNQNHRNHPVANLMAINYPVVIGNDDPSIWNASGLSDDWYVTFMAMTPKNVGLKFLKQMALNSIEYSAMTTKEKQYSIETWRKQWKIFIENCLTNQNLT